LSPLASLERRIADLEAENADLRRRMAQVEHQPRNIRQRQRFSRPGPPEAVEQGREDARTTTAQKNMRKEVIMGDENTPGRRWPGECSAIDIDYIAAVRHGVPVGIVARHHFLRMIAGKA
jgi:hypothetical protein